jgi:hypothetical protein
MFIFALMMLDQPGNIFPGGRDALALQTSL